MYNTLFSCSRKLAKRIRGAVVVALGTAVLVACGSNPVTYTKESFSVDSPYQKKIGVGAATACEAARRALLGDGYVIDKADSDNVKGRKAYHSEKERSTFIEMSVVCVPDPTGSTLYANGLLSTYEVKKSAASASVGVSAIGTLSLPIGQSADSMVKISDETINDRGFYRQFFVVVDAVLVDIKPEKPPTARPDAGRGTLKVKAKDTESSLPKVATPPAGSEPATLPHVDTQNGVSSTPLLAPPQTPPSAVTVMPQTAPTAVPPQIDPLNAVVPPQIDPLNAVPPPVTPVTTPVLPSSAPAASTPTAPEQPGDSTLSTQPTLQDPLQTVPQAPAP